MTAPSSRSAIHHLASQRLGNRLRFVEVVLRPFAIRPDVFGRQQPGIAAERLQLAVEIMRADAALHADQARRRLDLATRTFPPKRDAPRRSGPQDVDRVLPISMPAMAIALLFPGHGVLPFGASTRLRLLAGLKHGRTRRRRPRLLAAGRTPSPHCCCGKRSKRFLAERPPRRFENVRPRGSSFYQLVSPAPPPHTPGGWRMDRRVALAGRQKPASGAKPSCRSLKFPINTAIMGVLQEIPTYLARI
jgi:hypothetical protein